MYNNHVTQTAVAALLLVSGVTIVPAGGLGPSKIPQAQQSETAKTITGMVSDSTCKGGSPRKGETRFSCTLKCVHHEGADYVIVVDDTVYTLQDRGAELDKFAGGRATVVGHLDGKKVVVDSVTAVNK